MVQRINRTALGAVLAAGLLAAPAHAKPGNSSRIQVKLRAAERALDRAAENAQDGNSAAAVTQLAAVRRNLASAQKTALRKLSPSAAGAVARAQGHVVTGTAAMFDGLTGDPVAATATTLKAALDGRDAVVAAINALSDKSGYAFVLASINDDATGEAEDIADTLADDELTDEAKAALQAAATQVAATATATASSSTDDAQYPSDGTGTDADGEPCPERPADARGERRGTGFGREREAEPVV
jgi:hypothetical protein